jgi:hypothetical protein
MHPDICTNSSRTQINGSRDPYDQIYGSLGLFMEVFQKGFFLYYTPIYIVYTHTVSSEKSYLYWELRMCSKLNVYFSNGEGILFWASYTALYYGLRRSYCRKGGHNSYSISFVRPKPRSWTLINAITENIMHIQILKSLCKCISTAKIAFYWTLLNIFVIVAAIAFGNTCASHFIDTVENSWIIWKGRKSFTIDNAKTV